MNRYDVQNNPCKCLCVDCKSKCCRRCIKIGKDFPQCYSTNKWEKITDRPVQENDFVTLDVDLIEENTPLFSIRYTYCLGCG